MSNVLTAGFQFPPNPCVGAVLTNLIRPSLGEASPGHTVQCNNTYYTTQGNMTNIYILATFLHIFLNEVNSAVKDPPRGGCWC